MSGGMGFDFGSAISNIASVLSSSGVNVAGSVIQAALAKKVSPPAPAAKAPAAAKAAPAKAPSEGGGKSKGGGGGLPSWFVPVAVGGVAIIAVGVLIAAMRRR